MNMTKQYVNKYMNETLQFDHTVGRKDVKQTLFSGLALLGAALIFCLSQLASAATVSGYIYANGVIQNDSGAPFWVEYDPETGERIESTLRAAEGDLALDKVYQMAGDTYREYAALFQSLQALYPNSSVIKLPIADFQAAQFLDANGNALSKVKSFVDADKARFVIIAPPLSTANGAYQYYRAEDVVLAQMPIDPETWVSGRSLLILQETGSIQYETENNLGFATAFFSKPGEYVQSENLFRGREDTIWNPIREAKVTEISYGGFSDRSGRYSVELERVYCLPTGNTAGLSAELSFQSFNPRNRTGMYPYYLYKEVPRPCFTMNFIHVGFGMGLWTLGTVYTPPQQYFDFQVDFSVLNGRASIGNEAVQGGTVAVVDDAQDTTYASSASLSEKVSATDKGVTYDFDRDGIPDQVHLGRVEEDADSGEETFNTQVTIEEDNVVQGVYLSSLGHTPPALPDITRQLDDSLSLEHEGLLQTITEKDLKNTDVYLFRVSTGELIAERTGATLSASDHSYQGTGVSDGTFHYTLHIRGKQQGKHKRTGFSSSRTDAEYQQVSRDEAFAAWQAESGVNPALHERESDHLRPGEPVKIIAINRATGYMGSVTTVLDGQDDEGEEETLRSAMAVISKMVKEIQMGPPNLKIWAERTYDIESGLTATNSPITQTIGNEGAALNSDDTVVLHTQWLDRDGSPLPEALAEYGFTGRVARVVGENQVSTLSGIDATFSIAPGTHLEFIQISGLSNSNDHIYVQVSGEPKSRAPSFATDALTPQEPADKFATSGNIHSGRLRYRPDHYVPFLTKVWDEASSSALELAFNQVKLTNPDSPLSKPDAVYQWLYRPDFQYSVYEFKVAELNRVENGEPQNILQTETPTITSSDDLLQLIYSLVGSAYDTLDGFSFSDGKDQQLIFALGETEIRATVGSNQQVNFEDLSQLGALDSEDFLSLRLYSNNDVRNVLWEFAFEHLVLDTQLAEYDSASGETLYVSADDPVVPLQAFLLGYANRGPDIKKPLLFSWSATGGASLESRTQTNEDLGVVFNEVRLPHISGSTSEVSVKLLDGGDTAAKLPLIEVVPGAPVNIAHSLAGKVHMGRASNATLTITVTDQHGNRVADGTGVSFFVSDSLEVVSNDGATTNGEASVVVTGSDFPLDSSINIVVGEASKAVALNVHSLNVGLELANSTVRPGGEESVVVTVTDSDGAPVSGVEVELGTNYGYLRDTLVTTDAQGKAETVFTAPQGERTGSITAQVGLATATAQPLAVAYAPSDARDLAVNHAALIGDKTSAGTIVHNRYDGVPLEIAYPTARTIRALGAPGDSVTVHIGDDFDPNLPPLAAYYMNHVYEEVTDETGRYPLHQRAVQIVSGTRMGAGSRYQFNADDQSLVYGDALALLQQNADLGFSVEVMPGNGHTSEDGELVNLGQGALVLSYGDNRYHLKMRTVDGEFTTTSATAMPGVWYQVAARYTNGQLHLNVNGNVFTTPATGNLDFDWTNNSEAVQLDASADHDLVLGHNYTGGLNSLKWYNVAASPLMAFDNGAASQTVTIGEDGYTELTLRSQGNLHQNGSTLNLQRVAVYTQNVREYASVLSTDAFAQIAGMYAVALDPNAPPINIAGLENAGQLDFFAQHNIRFGLFNEAHAGILDFAWDAVNWILPLESFATVFQQLGYLAGIGNGEFEADVFIIALVDVVTVFPPAKPLAAFTRPLKALTKGLKNTNPRFMRYFAGALNGAVRKARKGDFDTLWNTLPFMVLAAQMWLEEDSRKGLEFLVSTVDSGDDVLSWIDYLALPADGWEGIEIPDVDPFGDEEPITHQSIMSFFIADVHAQSRARRLAATAAGVALTRLSKLVTKGEAQNLPDALRIIRNEIADVNLTDVRRYLHSPAMMKSSAWLITAAGARSLRGFVKGKTNARYSFPVIMATTAYLGWESACGTMIDMQEEQSQPGEEGAEPETPINLDDLQCGLGSSGATGLNGQVRAQVAKKLMLLFSDAAANPNLEEEPPNEDGRLNLGGGGHGALFHLVQTAYFQARHRFAGQDPIKFMEKQRWVTIQNGVMDDDTAINSECGKSGQSCLSKRSRNVDIILGKGKVNLNNRDYVQNGTAEPETWIELKSWAAQSENGEGRYRFAFEKIPKVGPLAPWVVEGTKAKLNWTAHLQFSLDRAANNIGTSWLSASEAGSEGVRMQQAVGEFQWRFQAFKDVNKDTRALRAISPKLGDSSRVSSFKYLVHRRPAVTSKAGFQESDIQDFSFASDARNFEQQAKFATLTELVPLIAQAGFAEITQHNDEPVDID